MSSLMDGVNEKNDDSLSTVERDPSLNDKFSEEYRRMARRILWKLDIHILPPLALVRCVSVITANHPLRLTLRSCGLRTSSTELILGMRGTSHSNLPLDYP